MTQLSSQNQQQYSRLKTASNLIIDELKAPSQRLLRAADSAGVLDELEILLEDTIKIMDDDCYLEEMAWEMTEPTFNN